MTNQNRNQNQSDQNQSGQNFGSDNEINPTTGQKWHENDEGYSDYLNSRNSSVSGSSGSGTGSGSNQSSGSMNQ